MIEHTACLHDGTHIKPRCIQCGKCMSVCPLFAATGREELSPKAKFTLTQALDAGAGELDPKKAAQLAALCVACGRCEKACPRGLCGPELVARQRMLHRGFAEWAWKQWLTKPGLLWPLARTLAQRFPQAFRSHPGMAEQLAALGPQSAIQPWVRMVQHDSCGQGRKAVLFSGCTARHAKTGWAHKAKALLTELGFELAELDFACCGCSLGHAGFEDQQRAMQRQNVDAWRAAGRPEIVAFCATCRCGLRSYARVDHGWETFEAEEWLQKVLPLADLLSGAEFKLDEDTAPDGVMFHRPCHGAGGDQDRSLLARMLGPKLVKSGLNVCCGFGGIMQLGAPELSRHVAATAWEYYAPPSAAKREVQLVTGCSACVLQLAATAPQGAVVGHWLELLQTP